MVEMRDGVGLRSDVFRPEAVQDRLPVLVLRNPYSTRDGIWAMLGQAVAQQGYAVVVQSCRGRYGSEGDFSPIHPDVEDGYDTVEWAAAQPWSNGSVGMYGVSYSGMAAVVGGDRPTPAPGRDRATLLHVGLERQRRLVLRARSLHPRDGPELECRDDGVGGGAAGGRTAAPCVRRGRAAVGRSRVLGPRGARQGGRAPDRGHVAAVRAPAPP